MRKNFAVGLIILFAFGFCTQTSFGITKYSVENENNSDEAKKYTPYYRTSKPSWNAPKKQSSLANKAKTDQTDYSEIEELINIKPYYKNWTTVKAYNTINYVGTRLLESSDLPNDVVFTVSNSRTVNAKTNVQDQIEVNRGLLKFVETEDELAGVLAHELGHVLKGDAKKALYTKVGYAALGLNPNKTRIIGEKRREYSADIAAADMMVNAGYNPLALISIVNKTSDHYIDTTRSHPTGRKRLANLYQYIETYYPQYLADGYPTFSYKRALKAIGK